MTQKPFQVGQHLSLQFKAFRMYAYALERFLYVHTVSLYADLCTTTLALFGRQSMQIVDCFNTVAHCVTNLVVHKQGIGCNNQTTCIML